MILSLLLFFIARAFELCLGYCSPTIHLHLSLINASTILLLIIIIYIQLGKMPTVHKIIYVHNDYLSMIKIFAVNNNCLPLIKPLTLNKNCLPLIEIFAFNKIVYR